jgi:radical SAM superfamily enzyme YgiQ (UPF0313 family)
VKTLEGNYRPTALFFADNDFLGNRQHVIQLGRAFRATEMGLPFGFLTRPEHIRSDRDPLLLDLKDAGWRWVSMGIEVADERKRSFYLNRKNTNSDIVQAFEVCHRLGVRTNAFLICGFFFDGPNDLVATQELLRKCRPDNVECSIYYPLSGSTLGEYYKSSGLIAPSNESAVDYFSSVVIRHPVYSAEQLVTLHRALETAVDDITRFCLEE